MRHILILAALALAAAPACASSSDDVPLSPIGMPFAPGSPQPVPPGHPLYHHVLLDPVADMPGVVGSSPMTGMIGAAKRTSFDKALRETLEKLNMLALTPAEAKFRLTPHWQALDMPFKISLTTRVTARMGWTLTRIDSGQSIFQRDIETVAESHGGDGSMRYIGTGRVALMTNIASATACLDKAAYGQAPEDCALTPGFTYRAPSPTMMFFTYRR